jgi:BirA family biotin operon repressor/biotin-[acetyl-CoA-carboxylase] ligase
VVADYQTAGRGCGTNRWESERGRNLLFSLLIRPHGLSANRQFHLSMAISLAISETLGQHVGDVSIKWPNDIYWRDGKIAGILIEHTLQGALIKDSIIGVGLNVNQREFRSDAPNPVSLWQISGQETNREELLGEFNRVVEGNIGTDKAVISAGISVYRDEDFSFHSVFERADARMYQRKMQLKGMGAATRD